MSEREFGPYRLVRQIAVGGMAEIHLAKTKGIAGFEKYVALKMIHPNFAEDEAFIQMLVDEAKIAVQLAHGNIAQTFDLGRVGETYYITMEYVDGADLYKILRRGSESDFEMPLDVCAFVGKEIASALDHAHRKRDNFGKLLGIVHRDVSPQNVLISYSGEVKLVDFGIAKATMKARQTAVGVIKGKYYYMSPEQAWGEQIDYRSDIFSAGIVLYEMITGQMLYLEEDLMKLLEMARKADIAPPSKLRKGIPPQLERIIMHALQKNPADRYQSAGDFATDLERFLHSYSPVFTAGKVAAMIKGVLGDPTKPPEEDDFPSIEMDNNTLSLETNDIVMDRDEIQDDNSVIFNMDELKSKGAAANRAAAPKPAPAPAPRAKAPTKQPIPIASPSKAIPSVRAHSPSRPPQVAMAPISKPAPAKVTASRPRQSDENTRQIDPLPARTEDSGLLTTDSTMVSTASFFDANADDGADATVVTSAPNLRGGGGGDDVITEVGTEAAPDETGDTDDESLVGDDPAQNLLDDDVPTIARSLPAKVRPAPRARVQPPAALSAKIQTPAVSEIRKPKASRRTPPGGVPSPNVLQQIVGSPSAPMPVPRSPATASTPVVANPVYAPPEPPPSFPHATPGAQSPYDPMATAKMLPSQQHGIPHGPQTAPVPNAFGSAPTATAPAPAPHAPYMQPPSVNAYSPSYPPAGYPPAPSAMQPTMPGALPTPPFGAVPPYMGPGPTSPGHAAYPAAHPVFPPPMNQAMPPGYGPQMYSAQPGYPPPGYPPHPGTPPNMPAQNPYGVPLNPAQLYPYAGGQQPLSLTGQLRISEADELPSMYKLGSGKGRWAAYIAAALAAIALAAVVTFLVIRSSHSSGPATGTILVRSTPAGADIYFDDAKLGEKTPFTIKNVPAGTKHVVRVEMAGHKPDVESVDIPKTGGDATISAVLSANTGTIRINTKPGGADIVIDGVVKGRTPAVLKEVDLGSKHLELRLKDHAPFITDLTWPASGEIDLDVPLPK